jgi:hypothetical protein
VFAFGDSITYGAEATGFHGYASIVADALGLPIDNRAIPGAAMVVPPDDAILGQMLGFTPPSRYEIGVTLLGTNDGNVFGTDAGALADFKAGLQEGLLHLTSRRRVPEPKTDRERLLARQHLLPSVPDGPRVFVGNTPKQIPGHEIGLFSPTVQALYAAAVAEAVAAVAAQNRRVYLVDVASVYDPATMDGSDPSGIHPADSGHAAIAAAFLAAIRSVG